VTTQLTNPSGHGSQVWNGELAWRHIRSEFADVVDDIVKTLAPVGPYAYSALPPPEMTNEVPALRIVTTLDEIELAYNNVHRRVAVRAMDAIVELRGDWYTFMYGVGEGLSKVTGETLPYRLAVLFPTLAQDGITGELFRAKWFDVPILDSEEDGLLATNRRVKGVHEQMLEAYRSNDADALAALFHPEVQTAIPDYVHETGTITELHTSEDARAYAQDFFTRFTVREVEPVSRYSSEWFVFSELSWILEGKIGDRAGQTLTSRTIEISEVMPDNLISARVGHGTPLAPTSA
jgi:hypothetical protein